MSESEGVTDATRRILQMAEDCADLFKDLVDRLSEMNIELGVTGRDVFDLVIQHIPVEASERTLFWRLWSGLYPVASMTMGDLPIQRVIARLFEEAPKLSDGSGRAVPGQAAALECAVMFKGGGSMQGALSTTPEGTLRMASPGRDDKNRTVIIESFFDFDMVGTVAVKRDVEQRSSSIIQG